MQVLKCYLIPGYVKFIENLAHSRALEVEKETETAELFSRDCVGAIFIQEVKDRAWVSIDELFLLVVLETSQGWGLLKFHSLIPP